MSTTHSHSFDFTAQLGRTKANAPYTLNILWAGENRQRTPWGYNRQTPVP